MLHPNISLLIIPQEMIVKLFFPQEIEEESESGSDSDSEMDLDLTVDFMALSTEAQAEINTVGKSYNLGRSGTLWNLVNPTAFKLRNR